MSHVRSRQDGYERLLRKKLRQQGKEQSYEQKREHYRKIGPIRMVGELKLTVRGKPIILSDDQKQFLNDLWTGKVNYAIVVAARGCLAGDARVQMFNGTIKEIKTVKVGDKVASFDITKKQICEGEVIDSKWHGMDCLCQIKGSKAKGNSMFLTMEHPILKADFTFEQAQKFTRDCARRRKNKAVFIEEFDTKKEFITDNKIKLLALLISEGYYGIKQTPKITNTDWKLLEEMAQITKEDFPLVEPKFNKKGNGWDLMLSGNYLKTRPQKGGRLGSPKSPIIEWLKQLNIYGQVKEYKKIPEIIFKSSNRQIRLFLNYFYKGDGNLYIATKKNLPSYQIALYAGLSKSLALDLAKLLMRLGIHSSILKRKRPKWHYEVRFYQKWKMDRFTNKSKKSFSLQKTGFYDNNWTTDDVYHIEVFPHQNFIAEGFVVHNAGKTLCLAIYGFWRVLCYSYHDISAMGGAQVQSDKIQSYISEWERHSSFVRQSILKNTLGSAGRHAKVTMKDYTEMIFMSCSETSVRGPHTQALFIDECCSAEKRGRTKEVKASFGEVSTSENIQVILTSTADWVLGFFKEVLDDPEGHGFTKYHWSIAKHDSGITNPQLIYKHKEGWSPNVPWVTQEALDFFRKNYSDEEWLVEILGGVGIGTGSVIKPKDLEFAVCDKCEECIPYKFPKCTLVTPEQFKRIGERKLGIDWGSVTPNAYTALGRIGEHVYVLFNDELVGVRDEEALDYAEKTAKQWNVEIVLPDPAQYAMNSLLEDRGLTIHKLYTKGGQQKNTYVVNVKRHFEHKIIHIPKAYIKLINSIRQLTYDDKGRVRKYNDHSWDSMMHGLSQFYKDIQLKLWKRKNRFIDLW